MEDNFFPGLGRVGMAFVSLISCRVAQFLTDHGPLPIWGLGTLPYPVTVPSAGSTAGRETSLLPALWSLHSQGESDLISTGAVM